MASTSPPLPDKIRGRPPTPIPFLSITHSNETMEPVTPHQPVSDAPSNQFRDSREESLYSITSALAATANPHNLQATYAGNALRSNNPYNGAVVHDFVPRMTNDHLSAVPKSSSSNSLTSTVPPSYRTHATVVSSTHGHGHGHAMRSPQEAANMNANPFADPVPRVFVQNEDGAVNGPSTPLPRSTPIYNLNQNHTSVIRNNYLHPSPQSSFAPTPPPKSPSCARGSNRWASLSSVTKRIHLGIHSSAGDSNTSLAREALALDSARRQDELLAAERARVSSQSSLHDPHLRPSPSAIRVAAELIKARDATASLGAQNIVKSRTFWIAVLFVQIGLVSTSAAVAVIIETDRRGEKAYVGTGRAFWLVFSLLVLVISVIVVWMIWLQKYGRQRTPKRFRGDEVGLLDRPVAGDMEMGRMEGAAGEGGNTASPRESLRERPRAAMPSAESFATIRTRDPEWQAMYATPKEIWQEESQKQKTLGDTPVRRGAYGLHTGSGQALRFSEQRSSPRMCPSAKTTSGSIKRTENPWMQRANPPRKPAAALIPPVLTRSDKSWPLRSSPNAGPFVDVPLENKSSPYQTPSPASDQRLLQHQSPLRPKLTIDTSAGTPTLPIPIATPTSIDADTQTHTRDHAESRVGNFSPLSSLTSSVYSASQTSLPLHQRPQYTHENRVASAEGVRGMRQRLGSFSSTSTIRDRDTSLVQSNTSSANERAREYFLELEQRVVIETVEPETEAEKRFGRRRSKSVDIGGVAMTAFPEMGLADGIGGKTHQQRAREVLAGVKGHFTTREQKHPRGRSLGGVVREKMAKLKEAGVEPDPEPTPPHPQNPYSPLRSTPERKRDPEVFIIGDSSPSSPSSPSQTPSRLPIPRKSAPHPNFAPFKTPSKETNSERPEWRTDWGNGDEI